MTEITKQKAIALSLLVYLTTKGGSTFTDDYYHHLKSEGYSAFDIEMTVERLINSGEIIYLGNDKYWIQITAKGENKSGKVRAGMTSEECTLSWGKPKDKNTTTGTWGISEQWIYPNDNYLYLENGILTTIQN